MKSQDALQLVPLNNNLLQIPPLLHQNPNLLHNHKLKNAHNNHNNPLTSTNKINKKTAGVVKFVGEILPSPQILFKAYTHPLPYSSPHLFHSFNL
jgi:hypothetical protein